MCSEILSTEGPGLEAKIRISNQTPVVIDDFTMLPAGSIDPEEPEFSYLGLDEHTWDDMFQGNPNQEKKLVSLEDGPTKDTARLWQ